MNRRTFLAGWDGAELTLSAQRAIIRRLREQGEIDVGEWIIGIVQAEKAPEIRLMAGFIPAQHYLRNEIAGAGEFGRVEHVRYRVSDDPIDHDVEFHRS